MSIILNALKKAEKERPSNPVEVRQERPSSKSSKQTKKSRSMLFFVSIGILFIASIIAVSVITQALADILKDSGSRSEIKKGQVVVAKSINALSKMEMVINKSKIIMPEFALTGIMMGFPPQVLIDGYFYEANDVHNEFEILQIQPNYIIVGYKGKEFKKRLK